MTKAQRGREHWRLRVKELRTIAGKMQDDPETKLAMLRLAADYERLAESAEERAKKHQMAGAR